MNEDQSWILELLRIMADDRYTDDCAIEDLFWSKDENGVLSVSMNCSDIFAWGCADAEPIGPEDLPDIEKARDDVRALAPGIHNLDSLHWTELWCARKREMRPQGAFFRHIEDERIAQLFADAGPQRQGGVLGDPDHVEMKGAKG